MGRKRGFFVKQVNIQDVASVPMMQEKRFLRAIGNSSKTNEWLRPQLVGKTYIFNPPGWMKFALKVAANFMSQQSLAKVWIHPGVVNVSLPNVVGLPVLCPFAQQFLGGAGDTF